MSDENPNVGKQFEEIMGKNFTPKESSEMELRATFGNDSDNSMDMDRESRALSRFSDFPQNMINYNEQHGFHVSLTTPRGWTHIWDGGPYITHYANGKAEDATDMTDYSKNPDQQEWYKGISLPTFMHHINEFESNAEDRPDEHKP